ncbi:MAG: protein kinase [bacterium]
MNQKVGTYELERLVATGGMAEVWTAHDPSGERLAIKRILPHLARDERFTRMFIDEARIASQLRHPNIARIYELGHQDDTQFLVMEFVDGADLADLLATAEQRNEMLPIPEVVSILSAVLDALGFAHEFEVDGVPQHIVHRDVSPHNVLVSHDGEVKLVDFGVAKAAERHTKTQSGVVKGKLSYMAPEQIQQEELDARADLFAVGVVGYELLTLQAPFGRELTAVSAILHDDPPDPREFRPDLDPDLARVLLRALQKNPNDRFQSASEMRAELEAWLAERPKVLRSEIATIVARLSDAPGALDPTLVTPPREETAYVAMPRPTHTTQMNNANPAWPMVVLLSLMAIGTYLVFFWESGPEPVDAPPLVVTAQDAPLGFDFEEDEWTEEWGPTDEELTHAASVWQSWTPADFMVVDFASRFEIEPPRLDPGDPDILSQIDVEKVTKKPRRAVKKQRRLVKKKEKRKSQPAAKPSKERKPTALERVNRALPSF